MERKRAIYINISIVGILCWGYIIERIGYGLIDYQFGPAAGLLVIGLVFRLKGAFFACEVRISQRNRIRLIVFIVLNYVSIIGYVIAKALHWPVGDYLIFGVIILYLILMGVYLEAVLKCE